MNTLVKSLGIAAVAGTVALAGISPAAAQPWWSYHRHHYHRAYAPAYYPGSYPGYYSGYYPGYYYDPGAAIAAGFIGGIFGTIINHASGGCVHVYHHNGKAYCR